MGSQEDASTIRRGDVMRPEVGKIYQIKESYIEKIKSSNYDIMPHISNCGNKFEFVSYFRSMMLCVKCNYFYETNTDTFFDVYELVKDMKFSNPNTLFKRKKR